MREDILSSSMSDLKPASSLVEAHNWASRDLITRLLLFLIGATLVGFFCLLRLYAGAPIMWWAWKHWLPNLNQEHGKLVIPIAILLGWYHRKKLRAATKEGSNWGLAFLAAGFLLVLLGTRAIQPRITM